MCLQQLREVVSGHLRILEYLREEFRPDALRVMQREDHRPPVRMLEESVATAPARFAEAGPGQGPEYAARGQLGQPSH